MNFCNGHIKIPWISVTPGGTANPLAEFWGEMLRIVLVLNVLFELAAALYYITRGGA